MFFRTRNEAASVEQKHTQLNYQQHTIANEEKLIGAITEITGKMCISVDDKDASQTAIAYISSMELNVGAQIYHIRGARNMELQHPVSPDSPIRVSIPKYHSNSQLIATFYQQALQYQDITTLFESTNIITSYLVWRLNQSVFKNIKLYILCNGSLQINKAARLLASLGNFQEFLSQEQIDSLQQQPDQDSKNKTKYTLAHELLTEYIEALSSECLTLDLDGKLLFAGHHYTRDQFKHTTWAYSLLESEKAPESITNHLGSFMQEEVLIYSEHKKNGIKYPLVLLRLLTAKSYAALDRTKRRYDCKGEGTSRYYGFTQAFVDTDDERSCILPVEAIFRYIDCLNLKIRLPQLAPCLTEKEYRRETHIEPYIEMLIFLFHHQHEQNTIINPNSIDFFASEITYLMDSNRSQYIQEVIIPYLSDQSRHYDPIITRIQELQGSLSETDNDEGSANATALSALIPTGSTTQAAAPEVRERPELQPLMPTGPAA